MSDSPVLTALVAGTPRDFTFSPGATSDLLALLRLIHELPGGVTIQEDLASGTSRRVILSAASQPVLEYQPVVLPSEEDQRQRVDAMVTAMKDHGFLYFSDNGWDLAPEA